MFRDIDAHARAIGAELDRVVDDVPDDLAHAIRVGGNRQGAAGVECQLDAARRRGRPRAVDHLGDELTANGCQEWVVD